MIYNGHIKLAHKQALYDLETINPDSHRQSFHLDPPSNWMNDPNGLVYFNEEYHVFFQYGPFSTTEGARHWGHYRSKDLLHWELLPPALAPDETYDKDGCFSGSAVVHNGKLHLLYTGHVDEQRIKEVQCLAVSNDGIYFEKYEHNPVIAAPPTSKFSNDFRDPKVWKYQDLYYMVIGNTKDGKGQALIYSSKNLIQWNYQGVLAESVGDQGFMWECPDLLTIGDEHVLVLSPEGMENTKHKSIYLTGEMDYNLNKFHQKQVYPLDYGTDFYAPQTFVDKTGRTIMYGWMNMWESSMPTSESGYVGSLTVPREITLSNEGKILQKPVQELKQLRFGESKFSLSNENSVRLSKLLEYGELEVILKIKELNSHYKLSLRTSEDNSEKTVIGLDLKQKMLYVDRALSGKGDQSIIKMPISVTGDEYKLNILLDRSSLEIFAENGEKVITTRIYPKAESKGIHLFMDGENSAAQIKIWDLEDHMRNLKLHE